MNAPEISQQFVARQTAARGLRLQAGEILELPRRKRRAAGHYAVYLIAAFVCGTLLCEILILWGKL